MSPQAAWLAGYSDPTKNPCLAGMKNIPERLVFSPLEAAENAARATRENENPGLGRGSGGLSGSHSTALTMSSMTFLASPNTIMVLSR